MKIYYDNREQAILALAEKEERDGLDAWILESTLDGPYYIRPISESDLRMRAKIRARRK